MNYQQLLNEVGHEEAEKYVAKKLRELADHLDSGEWPRVMHWSEPQKQELITEYTLTLSFPWPG